MRIEKGPLRSVTLQCQGLEQETKWYQMAQSADAEPEEEPLLSRMEGRGRGIRVHFIRSMTPVLFCVKIKCLLFFFFVCFLGVGTAQIKKPVIPRTVL